MRFQHSLVMAVPPERMWDLTLDITRWPEWTPTVTSLRPLSPEPLARGAQVQIKQPGQPSLIWTVTELEPPALFQWQTSLPWGLKMVGTHKISPREGGCVNQLQLQLSGPGAWPLGVLCAPIFWLALWLENRGFKRAAELA